MTFNPLTPPVLSQILEVQLKELHERLTEQRLKLRLTDEARALILEKGYDPINGARPLRRAVERLLVRPLSAAIVEDAFQPGQTIVVHATDDERLRFEAEAG